MCWTPSSAGCSPSVFSAPPLTAFLTTESKSFLQWSGMRRNTRSTSSEAVSSVDASLQLTVEGYQYCYFLRNTTRTEVVLLKVGIMFLLPYTICLFYTSGLTPHSSVACSTLTGRIRPSPFVPLRPRPSLMSRSPAGNGSALHEEGRKRPGNAQPELQRTFRPLRMTPSLRRRLSRSRPSHSTTMSTFLEHRRLKRTWTRKYRSRTGSQT